MAVTDTIFLFLVLPVTLLLYYIAGSKVREFVLLAVSLIFYACGSRDYFMLLLASLGVNISLGWFVNRFRSEKMISRSLLVIGVIYDVAILFFYKYFDFVVSNVSKVIWNSYEPRNLLLPLGLSFFTFKAVSYLTDVYMGKVKNNPLHAALYLSFFTQVQSGPLSRYNDMYGGDVASSFSFDDFSEGVYRFIIGFNKKILLANTLANITQETFSAASDELSMSLAWLGSICYSMQLFFDFAGYSDMAIGLSRMFGYHCPENFIYPYMSKSVSEFWRRWHVTLGAWFLDYVYIPLGGSRVDSKAKLYRNLFAVWFLTGIWHGANWNFIFWGLAYFCVIAFEKSVGLPNKLQSNVAKTVYRICSILFVNFMWVIFRADGLGAGLAYIKAMIWNSANPLADSRALFLLKDNFVFVVFGLLFCFPVMPTLEKWCQRGKISIVVWNVAMVVVNLGLFLCALSFVVAGLNNPFAYANF